MVSCGVFIATMRSKYFKRSLLVALASGLLSASLRYLDVNRGMNFIQNIVPESVVFNVFVGFASLVAAFRTSNALSRYTDAAMYMHRMKSCLFDATSSLVSFSRVAKAPKKQVDEFRQVLVRLTSLLCATCLEGLEGISSDQGGFVLEVLGLSEFEPETLHAIFQAKHRVEFLFQLLEQLVVDAHTSGVLAIAPPILSRAFQEVGQGMNTYNEAKKLSATPIPFAYLLITYSILVTEAFCVPIMMAVYATGLGSACVYSFGGTFLLWYMNGVADALDNPFRKEAHTLDSSQLQHFMNEQLTELLNEADRASVSLAAPPAEEEAGSGGMRMLRSKSLCEWKHNSESDLSDSVASPPASPKWKMTRENSGDTSSNASPPQSPKRVSRWALRGVAADEAI